MNRLAAALALVAALALSACYPPVTSHPVGSTVGIAPDPTLMGSWKGTDREKRPNYFHFLAQSDGTITILIVVGIPVSQDWILATATTARLGRNGFMNARLISGNGVAETETPGGTIPVLYRFVGQNTLQLALPDETKVKAAIRAGALKGTTGEGEMGDAIITAEPAALDKFFGSKAGEAVFATPFITLHRDE